MTPRPPLFAIRVVVLLLALSGLACSINVATGGAQVTVGDAPPTAAGADQPSAPVATEAPVPSSVSEVATEAPQATTAPVTEVPQPTESIPDTPTGDPPAGDTAGQTESSAASSETVPPAAEPAPASSVDSAPVAPVEMSSLDPRKQGLGHLETFRQRMTVQFTKDGSNYSSTYHYGAEVNTGASAVHLIVSVESPVASTLPSNRVEAIWIQDRLWFKVGNQPWIPVPESVAEAQFDEQTFAVDDFLPYAPPARRVQPDVVVNGVLSHQYVYDVQQKPVKHGTVSGAGNIYTAVDGGYVVRYTLDGIGTFDQTFEGSGTVHLVYDTFDVGAPITINPPHRQ